MDKTVAIINFTSGSKNITSCLKKSKNKYIITSRKFINQGNLEPLIKEIEEKSYKFIYLEDIKERLSLKDKIIAIKDFFLNIFMLKKLNTDKNAVILYTSGTESDPKGVGLTHQNLFLIECRSSNH